MIEFGFEHSLSLSQTVSQTVRQSHLPRFDDRLRSESSGMLVRRLVTVVVVAQDWRQTAVVALDLMKLLLVHAVVKAVWRGGCVLTRKCAFYYFTLPVLLFTSTFSPLIPLLSSFTLFLQSYNRLDFQQINKSCLAGRQADCRCYFCCSAFRPSFCHYFLPLFLLSLPLKAQNALSFAAF